MVYLARGRRDDGTDASTQGRRQRLLGVEHHGSGEDKGTVPNNYYNGGSLHNHRYHRHGLPGEVHLIAPDSQDGKAGAPVLGRGR